MTSRPQVHQKRNTTTTIDRWRLMRATALGRLEAPDEDPPSFKNGGITRTIALTAVLTATMAKLRAAAGIIEGALAAPDRLLDDAGLRADLRSALEFVEGVVGGKQADEIAGLCIEAGELLAAIETQGVLLPEERERARAEGERSKKAKAEHRERVAKQDKIDATRAAFFATVKGNPHAIGETLALLVLAAGVDPLVLSDLAMAGARPAMDAAHKARDLAAAALAADRKVQS